MIDQTSDGSFLCPFGTVFFEMGIAQFFRLIYTEPMKRGFEYVKEMCFFGSQAFIFSLEGE